MLVHVCMCTLALFVASRFLFLIYLVNACSSVLYIGPYQCFWTPPPPMATNVDRRSLSYPPFVPGLGVSIVSHSPGKLSGKPTVLQCAIHFTWSAFQMLTWSYPLLDRTAPLWSRCPLAGQRVAPSHGLFQVDDALSSVFPQQSQEACLMTVSVFFPSHNSPGLERGRCSFLFVELFLCGLQDKSFNVIWKAQLNICHFALYQVWIEEKGLLIFSCW